VGVGRRRRSFWVLPPCRLLQYALNLQRCVADLVLHVISLAAAPTAAPTAAPPQTLRTGIQLDFVRWVSGESARVRIAKSR
jgi:hypothetical protein